MIELYKFQYFSNGHQAAKATVSTRGIIAAPKAVVAELAAASRVS